MIGWVTKKTQAWVREKDMQNETWEKMATKNINWEKEHKKLSEEYDRDIISTKMRTW